MAQDAASVLREMNNAITLLNKNMENVKWATYAQNLIGCGSIIGNLVVIGFSMFGNNANPIKEATQQLMNRLDGISQQITNATSELKDFVAQTNYCTNIKGPTEHVVQLVQEFIKNKNERSLDGLRGIKGEPIRILSLINSLLDCDCGVEAQLERRWYTDEAFKEIEKLYMNMVKQLVDTVFAYGLIEKTVYERISSNQVENLVDTIKKKLDKANIDRANKYWDSRYMDGLINHCMVVHSSNENARDDLYKTMCDRYGNTGYYFAVGVYNACSGYDNHIIRGSHFCLFRRNGRNAFVLRNRKASSYLNSPYLANARHNWRDHFYSSYCKKPFFAR